MINRRSTKEKSNEKEIDVFIDRLAELLLLQIEENKNPVNNLSNEISKAGGRTGEKIKSPSSQCGGRKKAMTLVTNLPAGIGLIN